VVTEIANLTLLYRQGDTFHVMNPNTYEQLEIDVSLAGDLAAYFQGELLFVWQ
jgi:translation elongation factor P/translation initiation factor 5A